ncbi:MAG: bifunctional phosphoribosylaminoimidazolecarboxamide formyltransferase/IMP cyclohydrolase [Candidatus Levyibacteriota bacterium]|nr:MAG: bifunctional phosphoribosylaminoimidazolecarboxamide formyltransferase/IMP cyclohydrolase [Candidatus Levybacteria bacterium]
MQNKYALISVFDKTGIADFAKQIVNFGYKIISTGGTAKTLQENGVQIIPIQDITGSPESFDGRMKTISFQIESGILFDRSNLKHVKQAEALKIKPIDLVICNLYPFEKEQTIENIDVGGPTMIRAAAKNFKNVIVAVDPNDYEKVANELKKPTPELRKKLAAKAFAHLSLYDSQIAKYLTSELFPNEVTIPGRKAKDLRYGENPHQQASLYFFPNTNSPLKKLERLWGRELSLLNVTDINAGLASVKMFNEPAAAVIKHNNPCGIALGKNAAEALKLAIAADPESAFGGVMVLNKPINTATASVITMFKDEKKSNVDILAAPEIDKEAFAVLSKLRKSMGIYVFGAIPKITDPMDIKHIEGGFILQTADDVLNGFSGWEVVTQKKPTEQQLQQMQIAWKFITRIKSNAVIVVDKDLPMTRGIGTGQTSRVRAVKIALEQAGDHIKNAILASDSFFPFGDSVALAANKGISAIVQQGGSINDQSSIDAANKAGIAMVFTHRRAFWH